MWGEVDLHNDASVKVVDFLYNNSSGPQSGAFKMVFCPKLWWFNFGDWMNMLLLLCPNLQKLWPYPQFKINGLTMVRPYY